MRALKGHGLRGEGRAFIDSGTRYEDAPSRPRMLFEQEGRGLCRCGAQSPDLPSTAARKRWHQEHKQAVLDGRGPAATCLGCDPPRGFASFEDAQRHARAERHGRIECNTEARKR